MLSVLVCAVSSIAVGMEQSHDFDFVFETCPEQIASKIDSKSFVSLSLVSNQFHASCNAIPMKNQVTYFFSDAVEQGNKKMIDRFIAQPDKWMFVHGKEEEVCLENGTDTTIKIVKLPLGPELQNFVGDCSFYSVKQADIIVRYVCISKEENIVKDIVRKIYYVFNTVTCDDVVDKATKNLINCIFGIRNIFSRLSEMDWIDYENRTETLKTMQFKACSSTSCFFSFSSSDLIDVRIKKFGMLMLLMIAAQKNNMGMMYSIFDNSIISDWKKEDGLFDMLCLSAGREIADQLFNRLKLQESF